MPENVSVIIVSRNNGRAVQRTLESFDAQTLRADEYDVIVVDDSSTDDTVDRVRYIAERRVNVRIIDAAGDTGAGSALAAGLAATTAPYVLAVQPGDTAPPHALADLVAHAEKTSADVVIGHAVHGGSRVLPPVLTSSADVHPVDAALLAAGTSAALLRRAVVTDELAETDGVQDRARDLLVLSTLLAAGTVSVYADRPVLSVAGSGTGTGTDGGQVDAGTGHLRKVTDADDAAREAVIAAWRSPGVTVSDGTQHDVTLAWSDAALRVTVASPRTDLLVTARHADSGALWPLTRQDSSTWLLDAHTGAAGAPLARGTWEVYVQAPADAETAAADPGAAGALAVARAKYRGPARTALVEGRAVVAYRDHDGHLSLDIDTAKRSLINAAHPDASLATVTDTPAGTILDLPLPEVAVRGTTDQAGHLLVGGFALPARIVADDTGARLTAGLSALPGQYELRTRFRDLSGATPLTLDVGPAGEMTVNPTPPKEKAAPKAAAGPRATPALSVTLPAGMVRAGQAVVRRVPALRPLARKVRKALAEH